MKIAIYRESGKIIVDGEAREVDLSTLLAPGIEAAFFNTDTHTGFIQYDESQTENILERDLEGEHEENKRRLDNNLGVLEKPMYKPVSVPRSPTPLTWEWIEPFYTLWTGTPAPVESDVSEMVAQQNAMLKEVSEGTFGNITPLTKDQILAMPKAEYRAWFNDNFSTAQDLRLLLARLFRYILSRRP